MTKIAICDDDVDFLKRIHDLIMIQGRSYLPELRLFSESTELFRAVNEEAYLPDIAVLDIVMPGGGGIETAKKLNIICPKCSIIFLSAYLTLATEVYEARHSYFVLKNQAEERIGAALEKAMEDKEEKGRICFRSGGREIVLPVSEVAFFERKLKKTLISLCSGSEYLVSVKPDELLRQTENSHFIRCHQSFWVNPDYISGMDAKGFVLSNGREIPISRSRRAEAKSAFHGALCRSVLSHEF